MICDLYFIVHFVHIANCLLCILYLVFLLYPRPTAHFLHVYLLYFTNPASWLPHWNKRLSCCLVVINSSVGCQSQYYVWWHCCESLAAANHHHHYIYCFCRHNPGWVFPWHGLPRSNDGWLHVSLGRGSAWDLRPSGWDARWLRLSSIPRSPSCLILWACRSCQVHWKSRTRGQRYHRWRVSIFW